MARTAGAHVKRLDLRVDVCLSNYLVPAELRQRSGRFGASRIEFDPRRFITLKII